MAICSFDSLQLVEGNYVETKVRIMEVFDHAASTYDETFTNSCVGEAQREQVWKYVDKHLNKFNNVLEVNCGTGEDAHRWKFRGKDVVGTDISPEMIRIARKAVNDPTMMAAVKAVVNH